MIGVGAELFGALLYGQNQVGVDAESCFFQLFLAGVYYVCIAVDKENTEGAAPVRSCDAERGALLLGLDLVVHNVRRKSSYSEPPEPSIYIWMSEQDSEPSIQIIGCYESPICLLRDTYDV